LRGALSILFVVARGSPEAILDAWASSDFAKQNRDQPSMKEASEFLDCFAAEVGRPCVQGGSQ
jgi:hypothetical protein